MERAIDNTDHLMKSLDDLIAEDKSKRKEEWNSKKFNRLH